MVLNREVKMRLMDGSVFYAEVAPHGMMNGGWTKKRRPWWRWLPTWILSCPYEDDDDDRSMPLSLSEHPVAQVLIMPPNPSSRFEGIKVGDYVLLNRHFICRREWGRTICRFIEVSHVLAVLDEDCHVIFPL